ncbi:MAG: VWA domain-containing protein, partial [Clostridia bacterium]|nr:VWA domain-containing protein [Clostridia bacterium]
MLILSGQSSDRRRHYGHDHCGACGHGAEHVCHHHGEGHCQHHHSPEDVLYDRMVRFVNDLRAQGMTVGIRETGDMLEALNLVGFEDKQTVRAVMRSILAGDQREQETFDRLFNLYFVSLEEFERNRQAMAQAQQELEARRRELEETLSVNGKPIELREDLKDVYAKMPQSERDRLQDIVDKFSGKMEHAPKLYEGFIRSVFMKSLLEQQMVLEDAAEGARQLDSDADLMFRDIGNFKDSEIPKAYQLIDQVTRRINGEITARRRAAGRSAALDFRRTLRAGLSTGGALCRLKYKKKHSRRKRVVMLCDVSGSMLQFSEFAIRFIKSLAEVSDHSEIFLFSEQVQRVNPFALQDMSRFGSYVRNSGVWGRGTNVGRALEAVMAAKPSVLGP